MRKYEVFFILDADISDEATDGINDKLKNVVTGNGGMVVTHVPWGKKKLAYPVKKRTRGNYILMEFAGDATLVAELERNMRLDERVLKFITVKQEDFYDPDKEQPVEPMVTPAFGEEEEGVVRETSESEEYEEGAEEFDEGEEMETEEE